jgi:uncharacterized protein
MRKIFVDTSGWIGLINKSDEIYQKASEVYQLKRDKGYTFLTHRGILLETGNSLSSIRLRESVIGLKKKLDNSDLVETVEITDEFYESGWELFAERLDKDWGVVDCISFVVMERFGITEALTTDKHFEQAGFIKLL